MNSLKVTAIENFNSNYFAMRQVPIMNMHKHSKSAPSFKEDIEDKERVIFLPIKSHNVESIGFILRNEGEKNEDASAFVVELSDFMYSFDGKVNAGRKEKKLSKTYSLIDFNSKFVFFNEEITDYQMNQEKVISIFKNVFEIQ